MTNRFSRNTQKGISVILVALLLSSFPAAAPIVSQLTIASASVATAESNNDDQPVQSTPAASPAPATDTPPPSPNPAPSPATIATTPAKTNDDTDNQDQPKPAAVTESSTNQASVTPPTASDTQASDKKPADKTQTTSIQHNIRSDSQSGDASVTDGDDVGDATSGDANAEATVINVVNASSSSLGQGSTSTLVCNIYNPTDQTEVQRTILIDPSNLAAMPDCQLTQTESQADNQNRQGNSTQSSSSLVDIENNITLTATSGKATLTNNDDGGNATSGDATALANIINVVSSSVGAGSTFLGVINIHGSLRGDILVPQSFVDSLFADNGSAQAASTATSDGTTSSNLTSNINISNNVDLSAKSGDASVSGNDSGGNATSGDTLTNLTVFNLTGQEVIAKNSLLVFVNVMGRWVGLITNAPGSTSAAFTGGGTANSQALSGDHDSTVNVRNNVSVSAASGDASVSGNDSGGNATSGKATAGANILNLVHSSFNLNDWFGILFINVLGNWLGNFGIKPAENAPNTGEPAPGTGSSQPVKLPEGAIQGVRVFQFNSSTDFKPQTGNTGVVATAQTNSVKEVAPQAINPTGQVLGAKHMPGQEQLPQTLASLDNLPLYALIASLIITLGLITAGVRRYLATRA